MTTIKGGQPLKWGSPQDLQDRVDSYFKEVEDNDRPYTMGMLAYHLDLSRKQLIEYENRDQYRNIIKKARDKVRGWVEERSMSGQQAAGPIFWLKNNADFVDKQEVKHSGGVAVGIEGALVAARKSAEKQAEDT